MLLIIYILTLFTLFFIMHFSCKQMFFEEESIHSNKCICIENIFNLQHDDFILSYLL